MGNSNSPGVTPANIDNGHSSTNDSTSELHTTTPEQQPFLENKLDSEPHLDCPTKTSREAETSSASHPFLPDADLSIICASTLLPITESLLPPSEARPVSDSDTTDDSLPISDVDLPACFDIPGHSSSIAPEPMDHASSDGVNLANSSPVARLPSPKDLPQYEPGKPTITKVEQALCSNISQSTASTLLDSTSFENHTRTALSITTKEPAPIVCLPVPLATTYADAMNLAARYPDFASEILVNPISGTSRFNITPCSEAMANVPSKGYPCPPTADPPLNEIIPAVQLPPSAIRPRPVHTATQPNWALAPPDVKDCSTSASAGLLNKRERKESEEHCAKRSRDSNSNHNQDYGSKECIGKKRPRKRVARVSQPQEPHSRQSRPARVVQVRRDPNVSEQERQVELDELFQKLLKMQQQKEDLVTGSKTNAAESVLQGGCKVKIVVGQNSDEQMTKTVTAPSHVNFVPSPKSNFGEWLGTNSLKPPLHEPVVRSFPRPAALRGRTRTTSNEKASNSKVVDLEWRRANETGQKRDTQHVPRYVPPPITALRGVQPRRTSPFGSDANVAGFGRFVIPKADTVPVQDTVQHSIGPFSTTAGLDVQRKFEKDVDPNYKDLASIVFGLLETSKTTSREESLFHSREHDGPKTVFSGNNSNVGSISCFEVQKLEAALPLSQENCHPFLHSRNGLDASVASLDPFSPVCPKQMGIAAPLAPTSQAFGPPRAGLGPVRVRSSQPQCNDQIISAGTGLDKPIRTFGSLPNCISPAGQDFRVWDARDASYASVGIVVEEQSKTQASGLSPIRSKRLVQGQNREGGFDTIAGISGEEKSEVALPSSRTTDVRLQTHQKQHIEDQTDVKTGTFVSVRRDKSESIADEQVKMFPSFPEPIGSRRPCRVSSEGETG